MGDMGQIEAASSVSHDHDIFYPFLIVVDCIGDVYSLSYLHAFHR